MSSAAADMADYLADLAVGTIGVDLFVGFEPESPPDCVTLFDTGGPAPDVSANFYRPTIQVRVRALNYLAGMARMKTIHDELSGVMTLQQNDMYYFGCGATTEAQLIGRDDQDRFWIVQNFQTMREYASN